MTDKIVDRRRKNFFITENELVDREDLTIYEKMTYQVLSRYADANYQAFPSYDTLVKKTGASKSTVLRAIKSLQEKNLIRKEVRKRENEGNTSNLYTVLSVTNNGLQIGGFLEETRGASRGNKGGFSRTPKKDLIEKDLPNTKDIYSRVDEKPKEKEPEKKKEEPKENTPGKNDYKSIIDYLNEKADRQFRPNTKATKELINGRWEEGYRVEDFKKVIDNKVYDWLEDPEFTNYLRPSTLFAKTKFENYLNQKIIKKKEQNKTDFHNFESRDYGKDFEDKVRYDVGKVEVKTKFHNFKRTTNKYTDDELEEKVLKNFQDKRNRPHS